MASEYSYSLRIPQERVAILIGKDGKVKREIESAAKIKIDVDSKEGDVVIVGEDAIKMFSAQMLIKAIGRGFNPDIAKLILKPDYSFELIDIMDYAKTKNDITRLKGRVIGQEGKSRKIIEELTESYICVYGKTVGIIGEVESAPLARRAIESLLSGSLHSNVYKWLERKRREDRKNKLMDL